MITLSVIEFIIFSFCGWIIDSLYRSVTIGQLIPAPLFVGPFAPPYGLGVLIAILVFKYTRGVQTVWRILIATVAMIVLEYVAGAFCDLILGIQLWDYSGAQYTLHGYIDVTHSVYWLLAMVVFYYLFFEVLLRLEQSRYVNLPRWLDRIIGVAFLVAVTVITMYRTPAWHRLYDTSQAISSDIRQGLLGHLNI